jgi:RHS repeat-associated protein
MRAGTVAVGHPVDVASGIVTSKHTDVAINGRIRLLWERVYSTALTAEFATPLGPGWTTRYFATLRRQGNEYQLQSSAEGDDIFSDPEGVIEKGGIVRNLGTFQELSKRGDSFVITRWNIKSTEVDRLVFRATSPAGPWHLTSIENGTGHALDLFRDPANRLVTIRQRLEERTLELEYSSAGRVSKVSFQGADGTARVLARYDYDKQERLVAVYDALGHADRYEYNAESRMSRELPKDGGVFYFKYDDRGRCVKTSGLDRYDEKSFKYLDKAGWTWVTNSLGDATRYEWLASGQVITELDPLGGQHKTEYDEHGRIKTLTAADGTTVTNEYDEQGNLPVIVDQSGARWQYAFNNRHELISSTDPASRTWKYERDSRGNIVYAEAPTGVRVQYRWDPNGNLVEVTTPRGARRSYKYDKHGVITQVINEAGRATDYTRDSFGRVTRAVTQKLSWVFERDILGRVLRVHFEDGSTQSFSYDVAGNLSAKTDEVGRMHRYRFGPCRRLLETLSPTGQKVKYIWGTEPERLEAIVNEKGEEFRFCYDALGRLVKQRAFDNRESTFTYNSTDRLVGYENAAKEILKFSFDPCGRMLERHLPSGDADRLTYDASGQLLAAETKDCSIHFELDPLGRIKREIQGAYSLDTTFDVDGNRVGLETSLGHRTAFELNSSAQATRLTIDNRDSFTFDFDGLGREVSRHLPGHLSLTQGRDLRGRLIDQILHRDDGTGSASHADAADRPLLSRNYEYAPDGQLLGMEDSVRGRFKYVYDPEQRLIDTLVADRPVERFSYDATGNILSFDSQGSHADAKYAPGNRLDECGASRYVYDAQGRLSKRIDKKPDGGEEVWEFGWDALDQLRSVRRPDGDTWNYKYDFFGRRVAKLGPPGETKYVWDTDTIVHEITPAGDAATWVYQAPSLTPLAKVVGKQVFAVVADQLGVPRELVSRQGTIVWSSNESAWGRDMGHRSAGGSCSIRFPGQWFDEETGFHYNRHRYYDPRIGRYISEDPIGPRGELNFYRYSINPLNYTDPFGLQTACANRQKGKDFEDEVEARMNAAGITPMKEVTVEVALPGGGTTRVRADFVVVDPSKTPPVTIIECKSSPNAPYTDNQKTAGFPPPPGAPGAPGALAGVGTPVGNNGAGLGTLPPGTPIQTIRPGDPIPGAGPAPTTYDPVTRTWT